MSKPSGGDAYYASKEGWYQGIGIEAGEWVYRRSMGESASQIIASLQRSNERNYVAPVVKPKQFVDYPYARERVTKKEVLDLIREVLGFNSSQALPTIMDSKITPVVVLNDYNYKSWVYKWSEQLDETHSNYDMLVDNSGNVYTNNMDGAMTILDKTGKRLWNLSNQWLRPNNSFGPPFLDDYCFYKNYVAVFTNSGGGGGANDYVLIYKDGNLLQSINMRSDDANYGSWIGCMAFSRNGKYLAVMGQFNADGYANLMFYEGVV